MSPALRDLRDLLAPQVRVLSVCLEPKDLLEPLELLVAPLLANLVPQVDLENLAATDFLVKRETPEPLALKDQGESLDPPEALDLLASLLLASLDLQVFLDKWDPEDSLV